MVFFEKLDPLAFLLAFAVGIFMCYITFPKPKIPIIFPMIVSEKKCLSSSLPEGLNHLPDLINLS